MKGQTTCFFISFALMIGAAANVVTAIIWTDIKWMNAATWGLAVLCFGVALIIAIYNN